MRRQWLGIAALVLITWVGSFGIAWGVVEWRDDNRPSEAGISTDQGTVTANNDVQLCAAALQAAGSVPATSGLVQGSLKVEIPTPIADAIKRYCH